jgi:hypothetical protein
MWMKMAKFKTIKITLVVLVLTSLFIDVNYGNTKISDAGDVIEMSQIIQDVNGVGIVLEQDISNIIGNSFVYIFLALNQEFILNGMYIIGFDSSSNTFINYKLGDPFITSSIWFDGSNDLILNYGSVIYIDILDYLVAFGEPNEIKALVLVSPFTFTEIQLNINSILNEYKPSFISLKPNSSIASSDVNTNTFNPTISDSSSSKSTQKNNSSTSVKSEEYSSDQNQRTKISSIIGFEAPLLVILISIISLKFRNIKK